MPYVARFAIALVLVGGTAHASTPVPYRSGLHDYVLGRYAWSADEIGRASGHFADALAYEPGDPVLLRRTFDLAIAAGDQPLATKLAARLAKDERYDTTLALLRVTQAIQKRDWKAADIARQHLTESGFAAFVPVIEAWTLEGRGKTRDALAKLDAQTHEGFAKAYVAEHRAHLLAADRKWAEAAQLYQSLLTGEGAQSVRLRLAAAGALQAGRRHDEARRLLAAGGANPTLAAAIEKLDAGKSIGDAVTGPRRGVSELFSRMAADLARERPLPIALVLARLSTFLAPDNGNAWVVAADVLTRGGQYDAALGALSKVGSDDVLSATARMRRAAILIETERARESIALLEAAANASGATTEDWSTLGEAYQRLDRHADAIKAYDRAISQVASPGAEHWYLFFARGAAHEEAGAWPQAEADLRRALALAPKEGAVLNYLGYGLLDRGERLDEAQSLIEQALALRPDDAHIIDSLGWVHYRAGRYAKAVELLERAVAELPNDATVNEHLGDAYWKSGRRIEARHRWRAALDSDPANDARKRIAAKLDFGLDVALASTRP